MASFSEQYNGLEVKAGEVTVVIPVLLDSIEEIKLLNPSNWVLLELHDKNTKKRTKSGLFVTTETTWDANGMEGQNMDRIAKVAMLPEKLFYTDDESYGWSMPWKTDIELEVGDEVLAKPAAMFNGARFIVGDKEYRLVLYSEILCAKKKIPVYPKDLTDHFDNIWKEEYLPLNGYVFCKRVDAEAINFLDVLKKDVDTRFGIVKYMAEPVTYQAAEVKEKRRLGYGMDGNRNLWSQNYRQDDEGVTIIKEDKIMVRKSSIHILTEYEHHTRFFDEMYFVIQRRDIVAKIDKK